MTRLGVDQFVTLEVDKASNKVNGLAACNNYFGTAEINGTEFKVRGVGSTRKMCADNALMELESKYLATLDKVVSIKPDRSMMLTLVTVDGIEMRFIPNPKEQK